MKPKHVVILAIVITIMSWIITLATIVIAAVYIQNADTQIASLTAQLMQYKQAPDAQTQIIEKVGKLTSLPTNIKPILAVVSDINELKSKSPANAEVYKDAQNGDFVLGYPTRMIIYRDSENKIIYDGPNPLTTYETR